MPSSQTVAAAKGSSEWWQFGYLRSWQGMGRVFIECTDGCSCKPLKINAHAPSSHVSQTKVSGFPVRMDDTTGRHINATCPCTIRLTLMANSTSAGNKFKVEALFSGFRMYSGDQVANMVEKHGAKSKLGNS